MLVSSRTTTLLSSFALPFRHAITFPQGLFGFEEIKHFSLTAHEEEHPFFWLESNPKITFLAIDPFLIIPDYDPQIPQVHYEESDLFLLSIVNIHKPRWTINLSAPLLINWSLKKAKQILFPESQSYPLEIGLNGVFS